MLVNKGNYKFLLPQDFIKTFDFIETPDIIYRGKLNEEFISDIRGNEELSEGVICKGTQRNGAFCGGVWACKIKTHKYFQKLKDRLGDKALENWE